ncbi:hypothetical protein ABIB30_004565 [Pedobacter sp. UYP1]
MGSSDSCQKVPAPISSFLNHLDFVYNKFKSLALDKYQYEQVPLFTNR